MPANPEAGADQADLSVVEGAEAIAGLLGAEGPTEEPEAQPAEANQEAEPEPEVEAEAEAAEAAEAEPEADVAEAESGATESEEEPSRYTVKVNGEDHEVTLDELTAGYSREADYRQKTTTLAEERRTHETRVTAANEQLLGRLQQADTMVQALEAQIGAEEQNLDQILTDEGSEAYLQAKVALDRRKAELEKTKQAHAQEVQAQLQRQQQQNEAHLAGEQTKLAAKWPEFVDSEKGPKVKQELKEYLQSVGYADNELSGLYDSRMVLIARDGMLYRRQQKAAPAVKKKLALVPKMKVKPGAARSPKADNREASLSRLRRTGSRDDAAAAIDAIISK